MTLKSRVRLRLRVGFVLRFAVSDRVQNEFGFWCENEESFIKSRLITLRVSQ